MRGRKSTARPSSGCKGAAACCRERFLGAQLSSATSFPLPMRSTPPALVGRRFPRPSRAPPALDARRLPRPSRAPPVQMCSNPLGRCCSGCALRPALRRGEVQVRYRLLRFARRARKRVTYCFLKSKMIDFFTDIIFSINFFYSTIKRLKHRKQFPNQQSKNTVFHEFQQRSPDAECCPSSKRGEKVHMPAVERCDG